jgi:hypothetical protein
MEKYFLDLNESKKNGLVNMIENKYSNTNDYVKVINVYNGWGWGFTVQINSSYMSYEYNNNMSMEPDYNWETNEVTINDFKIFLEIRDIFNVNKDMVKKYGKYKLKDI